MLCCDPPCAQAAKLLLEEEIARMEAQLLGSNAASLEMSGAPVRRQYEAGTYAVDML